MIILAHDIFPLRYTGNVVSGDSDSNVLLDRNPSNAYTWTTAAQTFEILFDLYDPKNPLYVTFPINFLALFGASASLMGANIVVSIKKAVTPTYETVAEIDLGSDRIWFPLPDVYNTLSTLESYEYNLLSVRIVITMPATGTYYLGEIAGGFMESPGLNYQYGRSRMQQQVLIQHTTIGGVDWVYAKNSKIRNVFEFSWGSDATLQDIALFRYIYEQSEKGLYPIILVPDDAVRSGPGSCFYGRISSEQVDVEEFFNLYAKTIAFTESLAYEEPA
jgi:hypothetical protein